MKDYSGQWFFHFCESRTPLRSQKPGTFSLRNVCTHTHTCAYGLGDLGPPRAYIRRPPDASLALRLSSPYSIQHCPHLSWGNWGLTRLWMHEAELRDPYPDSLLRAFWLLEGPCLVPGRSCVVISFPSAWADTVDEVTGSGLAQSRLWTWPRALRLTHCMWAGNILLLWGCFFILQMEIIMRPALQGCEINWRILYWLWFEQVNTCEGPNLERLSETFQLWPTNLSLKKQPLLLYLGQTSREFLRETLIHFHMYFYFVQMVFSFSWGVRDCIFFFKNFFWF